MDFATYTIKYGDTLQSIAEKFTGDPWKYIEIVQSNPQVPHSNVIVDGIKLPILSEIRVGQIIHIPMYWIDRQTFVTSPLVGLGQAGDPSVGMTDPAAVYCEQNGGTDNTIKDALQNEYGICNFPNGSQCEEWAYKNGTCKPGDCIRYGFDSNNQLVCSSVPEQKTPSGQNQPSTTNNTKIAGYVVGGIAVAFLVTLGVIAVAK